MHSRSEYESMRAYYFVLLRTTSHYFVLLRRKWTSKSSTTKTLDQKFSIPRSIAFKVFDFQTFPFKVINDFYQRFSIPRSITFYIWLFEILHSLLLEAWLYWQIPYLPRRNFKNPLLADTVSANIRVLNWLIPLFLPCLSIFCGICH